MKEQEQQIDAAVMQALQASGQYLMTEDTLTSSVRLKLRPKPKASEIVCRVERLDNLGLLVVIPSEYGRKFKLSDEGKAWVAENL